ncbi:MAG: DUF6156 family protein [Bradyrhizobium sp.]
MADEGIEECRFFASYSGVRLPLRLVSALEESALTNRNTFIRAYFGRAGVLKGFDKIVYGEVELAHRYDYHDNGALSRAQIIMLDEAPVVLHFGPGGEQTTEEAR